jgi:hypothetical protein
MRRLLAAAVPLAPFIVFACASSTKAPTPPTPNAIGSATPTWNALEVSSSFVPACASAAAAASSASAAKKAAMATPADETDASAATNVDACDVVDTNLSKDAATILAAKPSTGTTTWKPWDHTSTPAYLDAIEERFALRPTELAALKKNGFVVAPRIATDGYTMTYHEIYQSELPLYVTVDSILHAVYVSNDKLIEEIENRWLAPMLGEALDAMHCALPKAAASYPPSVRHDLDLYLTVARSLFQGAAVPSAFGVDDEAKVLVAKAMAAKDRDPIELFDRKRVVDFTQYLPRGHYADDEGTQHYFRAAMWLSRLELNLVSRSCRSSQPDPSADPSETPREAVDALALADLADRSGVMPAVAKMDRAWSLLAGKREDVSPEDLVALRKEAGIDTLTIPESADKLRAAIGNRFRRTVRFHYQPDGTSELPAIATFLGPRIVVDSAALMPLVEPYVADRTNLGAADVAFALGHDRARVYLKSELAKHPDLEKGLGAARWILEPPYGGEDLYSVWLQAVRGLADSPPGVKPSFMSTEAHADLRIDSAVAGFGEIRHNYVLIAAQTYFQGGCAIPDAFVEPAPSTYDALVAYADRGASAMKSLDPDDTTNAAAYFARLGEALRVLRAIQNEELAGRALSDAAKRWLGMVMEFHPGSTGSSPRYDGWYFDLFRERDEGLHGASFVADYFTGEEVAYAGVAGTSLGLFVVDTGGAPRVMLGPVARAYEHHGKGDAQRLTDETAAALSSKDRVAPWAASYTVDASVAAPQFAIDPVYDDKVPGTKLAFDVRAPKSIGAITIELLDHHRKPIDRKTVTVGAGKTRVSFARPKEVNVEGVHVQVGAFHAWITDDYAMESYLGETFGGWTPPSP